MEREQFSIGATAAVCGLSTKTIRYYEEIGLIPPPKRRNRAARTGGNRVYDAADIRRLRFIRSGRVLGLSIEDLSELLSLSEGKGCPGAQPEYRTKLERHLRIIDERVRHLLGLKTLIEELLSRSGGLGGSCGCAASGKSVGILRDRPQKALRL